MERRLNAAKKLILGLSREQKRWTEDTLTLNEKKIKLLGDSLLCSAFLSYSGPFNYTFRKKMIYDDFYADVLAKKIPCSENFKVEELLTSGTYLNNALCVLIYAKYYKIDVQISQWANEGLPSDELSVQNGILTTCANRWPLCIDP